MADQLPASIASSVRAHTHRLSASQVAQQLLKSAALSTCVTSRHLTVIELTIHALICRLPSPFADQLSASSTMIVSSTSDVAVKAPTVEYAIPESTA